MFFRFIRLVTAILCVAGLWAQEAHAQQRISLIRDAEIETIIRHWATPLFQAAKLDPSGIGIHLVGDKSLNAFVAGGQHLFINTGLLMRAENPGQVIGVIAHETGHIAGGHLIRGQEALRNASTQMLLAAILGVAVGVAGGGGDAAMAILSGGSGVATSQFLHFSRGQEAAADQAGLSYLETTQTSAQGLLEFLEVLQQQDMLHSDRQDAYMRTHPLTRSRVDFVRQHVDRSPYSKTPPSKETARDFQRIQAKLVGFTEPFRTVLQRYPNSDTSMEARYARAIAYYQRDDLERALPLVDDLIQEEPANAYFHELRGQMLFENGRIAESLPSYEQSVRLQPKSILLRVGLARAQLETMDPAQNRPAMEHLHYAVGQERDNPQVWHLLAIGYGREQSYGMSALALAEKAITVGDEGMAAQQATRAQKLLPKGSPGWVRAQDIKIITKGRP
ncbi:MAG: M48 family metalloprotease [Alphaproteobacteria bacterium]|nr:M48 family metalloprotease [Alphaproteobacteria bacterium]